MCAKEEERGLLLLLLKITDVDLFKIPRIELIHPCYDVKKKPGIHLIPYNCMLQFSSLETIRFEHVQHKFGQKKSLDDTWILIKICGLNIYYHVYN